MKFKRSQHELKARDEIYEALSNLLAISSCLHVNGGNFVHDRAISWVERCVQKQVIQKLKSAEFI